jgi:hypothetical protein
MPAILRRRPPWSTPGLEAGVTPADAAELAEHVAQLREVVRSSIA